LIIRCSRVTLGLEVGLKRNARSVGVESRTPTETGGALLDLRWDTPSAMH